METQENDIPAQAGERYRRTWERYLIALRSAPELTLSSYCREKHIHYKGVRQWLKRQGLSVRSYKKYYRTRPKERTMVSEPVSQPKFIQIIPRETVFATAPLHGVNVKFPDGVTLTLQECTPEGIVSLIETYERRRSAREAECSL